MKVIDLIVELKKQPQSAEVWFENQGDILSLVRHVEEDRDGDVILS